MPAAIVGPTPTHVCLNGPTIRNYIQKSDWTGSCSTFRVLSLPWTVRAVAPFPSQGCILPSKGLGS